MTLDNIIGVKETADILGLSPGTVKNKCASGSLKCKKIGLTWVLDKTNLEEEMIMKTLNVNKVKKHDHIVGEEYDEEYQVRNDNDVERFIGHELEQLNDELFSNQHDDIDAIHELRDGDYSIDLGDFYLNVEVK